MTLKGYIEPDELERLVYDKLNDLGICIFDYPIDPYKLIYEEGIILNEIPFENHDIRGMIVHGENVSGIAINANRCIESRRFIAMHELSHYWFHSHESQITCFEEYIQNNRGIEWQANNAAAYALMPSTIIKELYSYSYGNIEFMSEHLQVSKESLIYRLQEIKFDSVKNPRYNYYKRDFYFEGLEHSWLYSGI